MFAIANDRKSLWQWDLNQQLTVAGDCTEVHYLDRGAPSTLTVAVKDGKADIPNILLQKAGRLVVYAYIIDAQDHHTKVCETFGIAPRPKPAEYVYTETEVKTWSDLQSQIGDLANLVTEEKENLVAAINEVAADMSEGVALDTTLTQSGKAADAKAVGDALADKQPKGDYLTQDNLQSATDVALEQAKASGEFDGADGKTAYRYAVESGYTGTETEFAEKLAKEMPTALPNPNALTFTGAVTGSYDGSAPLEVEIPSGGGGGTSEEFILLAEVTLEEDVKKVTLPLSSPTKHFITHMWCPKTSATSNPRYISIGINGSSVNLLYYLSGDLPSKDNKSQCTVEAHGLNDGNWAISAYTNLGDAEGAVSNYNQRAMIPIGVKNNGIMQAESVVFDVITNDATQYFPVGSILRVWGV